VTEYAEHQIATQVAALKATVEAGFVATHRRQDETNVRLDALDRSLRKAHERLAADDVRIDAHAADLADVKRDQGEMRQHIHALAPVAELARRCMDRIGRGRSRGRATDAAGEDEDGERRDHETRQVTRRDVWVFVSGGTAVVTAYKFLEWGVRVLAGHP
jgi:hypothetical protein